MTKKEIDIIAHKVSATGKQINKALELFSEGATIPFVARYRKELTGGLDEVQLEEIQLVAKRLDGLSKRKKSILDSIEEQGKLSAELKLEIEKCFDDQTLEDLYLPYKSRRKTKADVALEAGLEPLAKMLMAQNGNDLLGAARRYTGKDFNTAEDALQGAKEIAAQWVSERIGLRNRLRRLFAHQSLVSTKLVKSKESEAEKFTDYFDFQESVKRIKSHRLLAALRGANEGVLRLSVVPDKKEAINIVLESILKPHSACEDDIADVAKDAYQRLLRPSLENELIKELKLRADEDAIKVFAQNLRQLLLQPPLGTYRTLAIDPGFRTGCKVVCLDANGDLLSNITIFPHAPQKETAMAMKKLSTLVEQYEIEAIAIGNGTASRETERFVKGIHFDRAVKVFVVNEAGASVYSASKVAREEFPQYDVTVRGAVSIGRRLMDPLSELVKIDPKSIGVGQYQHDVDQKLLQEKLDNVVISCVNSVGIDLNTASKYLLNYVSGIGPTLAQNIVDFRSKIGRFEERKQLLEVTKLGKKAFEQAAGFLRVNGGSNPLDNSGVHPERYNLVSKMIKSTGTELSEVIANEEQISKINLEKFVDDEVGLATLEDIVDELKKPGRDPRKMVKVFEFDKTLKNIDQLEIGKQYPGIVNNVTNFGAFVDIGIKENGLIHISNLADEYISNPADVIALHEHVVTEVISVDKERKRIGLKLIKE